MNKKIILHVILLLSLSSLIPVSSQTGVEEGREEIFAPFASRFRAETKGASILLSWKDARNLDSPVYKIYYSDQPFNNKESLNDATLLETLATGEEQYLFEPGNGDEWYFLVLVQEGDRLFDVFIPYRNMNMEPVGAVLHAVEEERTTYISDLKVNPDIQDMQISALSSRMDRPVLLFRSVEYPRNREDLLKAARVATLSGGKLQWKDTVVPGIPFYYALVDKDLFEAGSEEILYEGSVTLEPVIIPLDEWSPAEAHSFQFPSRHIPLPVLNISSDIEQGKPLPGPALPDAPVELSGDTALKLAALNFGKSVRDIEWKEVEVLDADRVEPLHSALEGIPLLLENQDWESVITRTDRELNKVYDREILARLHYYRGEALYFRNEFEYAFMDFLTARELYYSESNEWIYNIFKLKQLQARKERVEF